ncbi:MAG: cytochrome c [Bauldia sp.]|nr:cytochrome c [Bauldia sp.]MCW5718425.1 cytochrome c [Bauldia sp.]
MPRLSTRILSISIGAALLTCSGAGLSIAQGTPPTPDAAAPADETAGTALTGVYTEAQAEEIRALYTRSCVTCHGATLNGTALAPPLAGFAFTQYWESRTLLELFQFTQENMPADRPGTMTPAQTAGIIALILKSNNYPAGETELPTDEAALGAIIFGPPPPAAP